MENGVVNVARMLDPAEFEVHVACLERRGAFAERVPKPDNVVVLGKKSGFSPLVIWRLQQLIFRIKPAVVHTHNLGPLIYAVPAAGFGLLCPILHGEHASMTDEERSPRRLFQRRLLYRACARVHTVTGALSRHFVEHGFPVEKITTIMNGVNASRFIPGDPAMARRHIGIPEQAEVIGIVGRFGPFKRHAMLLEAFQTLAAIHPALHLLVVGGGGPEQDNIYQKAREHPFSNRIHLTGFQENPVPYYQALDLLVVPSANEGLSNAILEAMACGIPILANDACGNRDVIDEGENGFVADIGSWEKLHLELMQLLANPKRLAAMRGKCREKAERVFSIDQMAAGYAALYRTIGKKNSRFQT